MPEHERGVHVARAPKLARVRPKVVARVEVVLYARAHHEARVRLVGARVELRAPFDVPAAHALAAGRAHLEGEARLSGSGEGAPRRRGSP